MRKSNSAVRVDKSLPHFSSPAVSPERRTPLGNGQPIFVKDGEHCWIVRPTDIILLESDGNYTRVHFGSNRALLRHSLKYLEGRLDPTLFFRASRDTIFNLRYVKHITPLINGGFLVSLVSGLEIEISRRQAQQLKNLEL